MPLPLRDRRRPVPYPNAAISLVAASSQNGNITDALQSGLDPGTSDWSIEAWVHSTSLAALRTICAKGATSNIAGAAEGYWFFVNTTGTLGAQMSDTANTTRIGYTSAATISVNTWAHVVANFDRDLNLTAYINGTATTATAISTRAGTVDCNAPFAIGSSSNSAGAFGSYWQGYIDALRFRNRLMTVAEISRSYNNGIGLAYRDLSGEERAGVVSAWELDYSLRDAHGQNHLAPANSPTYFVGKR